MLRWPLVSSRSRHVALRDFAPAALPASRRLVRVGRRGRARNRAETEKTTSRLTGSRVPSGVKPDGNPPGSLDPATPRSGARRRNVPSITTFPTEVLHVHRFFRYLAADRHALRGRGRRSRRARAARPALRPGRHRRLRRLRDHRRGRPARRRRTGRRVRHAARRRAGRADRAGALAQRDARRGATRASWPRSRPTACWSRRPPM